MTRSLVRRLAGVALLCGLTGTLGCTEDLPTLGGVDRFPEGGVPLTLEHVLETDAVLRQAVAIDGETTLTDAAFLFVANKFDGSLDSHVLVGLPGFPDTVEVEGVRFVGFKYVGARVLTTPADSVAAANQTAGLVLSKLVQPWEPLTATWEHAVDTPEERTPWQVPGGTATEVLSATTWFGSSAPGGDTIVWNLPAALVQRLADDEEMTGLMVSMAEAGGQLRLSPLVIELAIIPLGSDSTFVTRMTPTPQGFVFAPEPPRPPGVMRVGGIASDRTFLRLDLRNVLPTCAEGVGPGCAGRLPQELILNRIDLILDPVPVTQGFRPVSPLQIMVRSVVEPELEARAPLGQVVGLERVSHQRFDATNSQSVSFNITLSVRAALQRGDPEVGVVLLTEPEASSLASAWFAPRARLRYIYTLPQRPQLP